LIIAITAVDLENIQIEKSLTIENKRSGMLDGVVEMNVGSRYEFLVKFQLGNRGKLERDHYCIFT
jgi:hypothetical protein